MSLFAGNANEIVETMRRADSGADITDATLTAKVYDPHGTLIDTVTLAHYAEDEYRGTSTVNYVVGVRYRIEAKASNYQFSRVRYEVAKEPVA